MGLIGRYLFPMMVIAVVGTAIIGGLWLLGTPAEQRAQNLDARRVADLRHIARAADGYWKHHGQLPASLEALVLYYGRDLRITDPESKQPYTYRMTGLDRFELCAEFAAQSPESRQPTFSERPFSHGIGRQCFDLRPPKT